MHLFAISGRHLGHTARELANGRLDARSLKGKFKCATVSCANHALSDQQNAPIKSGNIRERTPAAWSPARKGERADQVTGIKSRQLRYSPVVRHLGMN